VIYLATYEFKGFMEVAVAVIVVMLLLLHPAAYANNASALLPASAKTNAMLVLIPFPFFLTF